MSRLTATALLCLVVPLGACKGCKTEQVQTITLPEAADKAIFATVEQLGPHRCLASVVRTDFKDGVERASHEETVDVAFRSWDRFRVQRLMDGRNVSEIVVVRGKAWMRQAEGPWDERDDAETSRVQLQNTWDIWDEALEPFLDRVQLTEEGKDLLEGRPTQRYAVGLTPLLPDQKLGEGLQPSSLLGTVWIDEAPAVRLMAQVEGTLTDGSRSRTVRLKLARSDFGVDLGIRAPDRADARRAKPGP